MGGRPDHEKIGLVEIIIGSFFTLSIWIALLVIKLVGIGLVLYVPIRAFGVLIISIWLWWKGDKEVMKLNRWLKKILGNLVPFFPTLFITFLVEVYLFNHPKSAKVIKKGTQLAKKIKSKEGKVGLEAKNKAPTSPDISKDQKGEREEMRKAA